MKKSKDAHFAKCEEKKNENSQPKKRKEKKRRVELLIKDDFLKAQEAQKIAKMPNFKRVDVVGMGMKRFLYSVELSLRKEGLQNM